MDEMERGDGEGSGLQAGWMQIQEYSGTMYLFMIRPGSALHEARQRDRTCKVQLLANIDGGRVRSCQLSTSLMDTADCSLVSVWSWRRSRHCHGTLAFYGLLSMWGAEAVL